MSTVEGSTWATVTVDGIRVEVTEERPLLFGRESVEHVVGLDPRDMGISAMAGAVEFFRDMWWVHNCSTTRYLLLDLERGAAPLRVACRDRFAITSPKITVLVPGEIATHRLVVEVSEDYLEGLRQEPPMPSGTISSRDVQLSDRDRDALTALLAGFLEPFPRYHPHPATYAEAAARLGPPWDNTKVRKQVERFRARLAKSKSTYIDGPRANYELAEFLIANSLLTAIDLQRLKRPKRPETRPDNGR